MSSFRTLLKLAAAVFGTAFSPLSSQRRGRGASRILVHIAALAALYIAFSGALFLGLQVSPLYGNLGLVAAFALAGLYVWLAFVRR